MEIVVIAPLVLITLAVCVTATVIGHRSRIGTVGLSLSWVAGSAILVWVILTVTRSAPDWMGRDVTGLAPLIVLHWLTIPVAALRPRAPGNDAHPDR